jgi:hypothetical protein
MRSHDLAKFLLEREDGEVECSVDISTCEEDSDRRCFGELVEVGHTPTGEGFGSNEVMLLFVGCLNN